MSSEQDEILHPLDAILKDLPPSMAGPVKAAADEVVRLRDAVQTGQQAFRNVDIKNTKLGKDIDALTEENEGLRVRLHSTELDVARLRGYQDRVNEFDPVSDRDSYEDRLPRTRSRDQIEQSYVAPATARQQWFSRRGA